MADKLLEPIHPNALREVPAHRCDWEGELYLQKIECLRFSRLGLLKYVLCSLLSCGLLNLLANYFPMIQVRFLYEFVELTRSTHFLVLNADGQINVAVRLNQNGELLFENRHVKYRFSEERGAFVGVHFDLDGKLCEDIAGDYLRSVRNDPFEARLSLYGPCFIEIPVPTLGGYLSENLRKPQFILQYIAIGIWLIERLYVSSLLMLVGTLLILITSFYLTRKTFLILKRRAEIRQKVRVFRSVGEPRALESVQE